MQGDSPRKSKKEGVKNNESLEKKWREMAYESRVFFREKALYFAAAGFILIIVGMFFGYWVDTWNINTGFKITLSFPIPLIGSTILAIVVQSLIEKIGKYKATYKRVKADAMVTAEDVSQRINKDICERALECEDGHPWHELIEDIHEKRTDLIMEEFFKDAKEIDILTPNLSEIFDHSIETIIKNPGVKVRMMSLHPECSAVYRRWNDMGTNELGIKDIKDRKKYSGIIRDGLTKIHKLREKEKLSWQIKTYTSYPVILIYRADDNFLLGFPLMAQRVRDQFHLNFRLYDSQNSILCKNEKIGTILKVGGEIREDLMRHFNKIWNDNAMPWISREKVFKKILETPLSKLETFEFIKKVSAYGYKSLEDLVACFCSSDEFNSFLENGSKISPPKPDSIEKILNSAIQMTNFESISTEYRTGEEEIKKFANNFAKFLLYSYQATYEFLTGTSCDEKFGNILVQEISCGVDKGEFEFEDLAEAIYIIKRIYRGTPGSGNIESCWNKTWREIEKRASNWAR